MAQDKTSAYSRFMAERGIVGLAIPGVSYEFNALIRATVDAKDMKLGEFIIDALATACNNAGLTREETVEEGFIGPRAMVPWTWTPPVKERKLNATEELAKAKAEIEALRAQIARNAPTPPNMRADALTGKVS